MHPIYCLLLTFVGLLSGCAVKQEPHVATSAPVQTPQPARAPGLAELDPIGRLVAQLASTYDPVSVWNDGLYTRVDLPSVEIGRVQGIDPSVLQVVDHAFQRTRFDQGRVTAYQILETRDVWTDLSVLQAVDYVFQRTHFDRGRVTAYQILEMRNVWTDDNTPPGWSCKAVLVKTDIGRKIVLLRWSSNQQRWWAKTYEAQTGA